MIISLSRYVVILWALYLGLAGCASYPISHKYRSEAIRKIPFTTVQSDPTAYIGNIVIWGGKIVKTVNDSTGGKLYILQTPLDNNEFPANPDLSQGRFIATSSRLLDPQVYKDGKRVTLAGQVTGSKTEPIDKAPYRYPVVQIKEIHLWEKQPVPYAYYPYGWNNYPFGYGFYDDDDGFYNGFYDGYGDNDFDNGESYEGNGFDDQDNDN